MLIIDDKERMDAVIVVMLNFHAKTKIISQERESHEKLKLM